VIERINKSERQVHDAFLQGLKSDNAAD
jgi:hypothetical protein